MKNFELPVERDLTQYYNIKKTVEDNKTKWNLLFDFNENIENLSKEEWLGIRN